MVGRMFYDLFAMRKELVQHKMTSAVRSRVVKYGTGIIMLSELSNLISKSCL